MNGGELVVVSEVETGKVKRIRNNGNVVVTVCGLRGQITPGAPSAQGTARLLDQAGTEAGRRLLARKYVMSRIGNWFTRILHLHRRPLIGIAVTF
jgi:hypothetical protein